MDNPKGKVRDKAWEHVTQRTEENGKKIKYHSMMDKEGTDGASSALITRDYDGKVTSLASATASTTGVHLEKTPTGPTPSSSSSSVGSSMFFTLENKPSDQPTVSSSILSSVSNSDMILVGDYQNKYNYGDLSPEEKWRSGELKKIAEELDDFLGKVRTGGSVANYEILGFAKLHNIELTLDNISRATLSSLPDEVVGVTSLPSEEEEEKEEEEQAKKKQSVDSNKDVALEEMINATAADAQQQARAIAVDRQEQLCKVSEALLVLASASSVSREREEFLKLVNEKNLYRSMMDKEGTDGEQAAHEEINDSTDEHVHDGASSALINRDYDGKVTSEEFAPATASTTGVHLEKTPTGPTLSSSSVPSGMVLTQENKPNVQPTVPCYKLSSVSNSDMSLVGDYHNKYKYGPEDHNASKVEERPAGISLEDDWRRRIEERLLAQEASIRDLSNCVGSLEETVKKHMTELSAAISVLIVKNKPSSDVFQDGESSSRVVDDDEEEEKDSPPPPVTQAAESTNHFSTPESETAPPDTNTTVDAQTSSGIQYTPGVLHDDEDEDHFSSVFEQAAAVLDDDEDEDHLPPVFEQAMSEKRPTGVSESDVEEEEQQDEEEEAEEEEEEDSPVIQVSMDNPKGKVRDKAWEHVTQRTEETGKKVLICNFCRTIIRGGGINRVKKHLAGREGEVAPCKRVDSDVRVSIQASLKEIDRKRKDKASGSSNVVVSDDDEEEKEANKVQKGLTKNELREIIAEEVTRAIQATMPTILEQNMEKTCKMLEERFGVEKEKKQVNEDVVVVGENNEIKRRRGRSGKI